jgi:hypothetical protein
MLPLSRERRERLLGIGTFSKAYVILHSPTLLVLLA